MDPKFQKRDKKSTKPSKILTVYRGEEPSATKPFFKFRTAGKGFAEKYETSKVSY
jgi:hypothetical protein